LAIILYLKMWLVLLLAFLTVLRWKYVNYKHKKIKYKIWSKFRLNTFNYYLIFKIVIGTTISILNRSPWKSFMYEHKKWNIKYIWSWFRLNMFDYYLIFKSVIGTILYSKLWLVLLLAFLTNLGEDQIIYISNYVLKLIWWIHVNLSI